MSQNLTTKPLLSSGSAIKANQEQISIKSDLIQNSGVKKSQTLTSKVKKQKKKQQTQFTSVLKVFNLLIGALFTAFGVYFYYSINQREVRDFQLIGYIMPGYIIFSGLIILAIEMRIKFIRRNMKFLYNYFGRGLFNIYVGIMPLNLLDTTPDSKQQQIEQVAIYILVVLLVLIGVLYILSKILCCAKEDPKKKRKNKKESTDSDSDSD